MTDLSQLDQQFLEIIRLYSAVLVVHTNPAEIKPADRLKFAQPEARKAVDICNLTDCQINLDVLKEQYKDEMWEPAIWDK